MCECLVSRLPRAGLSALLYDSRTDVKASLRVHVDEDGTLSILDVQKALASGLAPVLEAETEQEGALTPSFPTRSANLRQRLRPNTASNGSNTNTASTRGALGDAVRDSSRDKHDACKSSESRNIDAKVDAPRNRSASKIRHSFHALPTPLLRETSACFERAAKAAVEAANAGTVARHRLEDLHSPCENDVEPAATLGT
jgi:hypothetical protein